MPRHLRAGSVCGRGIIVAGGPVVGPRDGVVGDEQAVGAAEQLVDVVAEVAEPGEHGTEQHIADLLAAAETEQAGRVIVKFPQDRDDPVDHLQDDPFGVIDPSMTLQRRCPRWAQARCALPKAMPPGL